MPEIGAVAHQTDPNQQSRITSYNVCYTKLLRVPPPLKFDILEEIERRVPGFPIVLHGASSVMAKHIEQINRYGGKMENTAGIPEEQLRRAAALAVCKVNIDSDGRLAMTAAIRQIFAEKPSEFRNNFV